MSAAPVETTSGEEARRAHSILSAVREAVLVWYAVLGGIAAWTIHLMVLVSVVKFTCNAGHVWIMHLTTVATLAMCAVAILLCLRMLRASSAGDESSDDEGGRTKFLARLGLLIGASNFLLIALEGLYVFVLGSRRCG